VADRLANAKVFEKIALGGLISCHCRNFLFQTIAVNGAVTIAGSSTTLSPPVKLGTARPPLLDKLFRCETKRYRITIRGARRKHHDEKEPQ
jgi:hypothetical protein